VTASRPGGRRPAALAPDELKKIAQMLAKEHGVAVAKTHRGVAIKYDGSLALSFHPNVEARWGEFEQLVQRLAEKYKIDDQEGLRRAVDTAMRLYFGRGELSKVDAEKLKKSIPEIIQVLADHENAAMIARMVTSANDSLIHGGKWDMELNARIIVRLLGISDSLAVLLRFLQRPRGRRADIKLHAMVASLERYWAALPGKKLRKTLTPKDKKAGHQLAKSDAVKFCVEVVTFIDPAVVAKVASATRHRVKRNAKIGA
jgi:hypothetical protein